MRAHLHDPLDAETLAAWENFGRWPEREYFPQVIGLVLEEMRTDYARMRLPYRPELDQPAGVVHGGALASLVDSVVVPAIGQAYPRGTFFATVTMTVNYLGGVKEQDVVAEGWVTRRGRTTVFCQVEAFCGDRKVVEGSLVYAVRT